MSPRGHRCARFRLRAASCLARREAREGFTLEAELATTLSGLERARPRAGHPSVVFDSRCARGPGTSRVPEPAPLQVRSRRGLRAPPGAPSRCLGRRLRSALLHRFHSLSIVRWRVTAKAFVSFELGRACLLALLARAGVAALRCTRLEFCTPNNPTRALRASSAPGAELSTSSHFPKLALRARPRSVDCAPLSDRPSIFIGRRTEERAPKGSEPIDAIEARGIRVSRRGHPLRRPVSIGPAAFSSAAPLERLASDTPVASSARS